MQQVIRLTADAALSTILEHDEETSQKERLKAFLVPEATVTNQGVLFDVVKPADRRSCCFTKAYGRYVEGTGSVLQTNANARDGDVHDMRLRYLTPREIARLHCFPDDYGFPPGTYPPPPPPLARLFARIGLTCRSQT